MMTFNEDEFKVSYEAILFKDTINLVFFLQFYVKFS